MNGNFITSTPIITTNIIIVRLWFGDYYNEIYESLVKYLMKVSQFRENHSNKKQCCS